MNLSTVVEAMTRKAREPGFIAGIALLLAAIGYWIIGFPCAYGLAFFAQLGAVGVWIGLSGGTAIYALLLMLRFWRLAGRLQVPS